MNQKDFEEFVLQDDSVALNDHLAPSSFGKTFMIHYALQVSLKHPGIFSQPTMVEIDMNIDSSREDFEGYESLLQRTRDKVSKLRAA